MKKRLIISGTIAVPILIFFVSRWIANESPLGSSANNSDRTSTPALQPPIGSLNEAASQTPSEGPTTGEDQETGAVSDREQELRDRLETESQKMGLVQEDPTQVEIELNDWARSLAVDDLKLLSQWAKDTETEPDTRFLAVDVLSRSNSLEAAKLLAELVLAEIAAPSATDPESARNYEFEMLIKQRALDGIAEGPEETALPTLTTVAEKTSSSIITERARRHMAALQGKAPPVNEQEAKALENLLKTKK